MKYLSKVAIIIISLVLCAFLVHCHPKRLRANEELRLTSAQLHLYTRKAEEGDALAAKKLWHHYTFAVGDLKEGQKWKSVYDDLNAKRGEK
jgi:hypothetical protein